MYFSFVTLFPNLIKGYFSESILKRAIEDEKISIDFYNPRDFTTDKHNRVDAPMIGGGAGMLMTPQPLMDTLHKIRETSERAHVVFLSPVAKPFTQNDAKRLAKKEHIVFVSGRYEGIDERVIEAHADEIFSIGDFILTGGELASMVVCDAISRNVEGVLGNNDSLSMESFETSLLEAPSFTKPKNYENNEN
ncbi:MAG: tRNA (guanosine(37)-N1)-methyltransferase TrmD, partial [Sulfurovum sp.]|nr:tRNA (guanosine(37)-N1)-methyltransferase TrmD [Sulfurovum sp.]